MVIEQPTVINGPRHIEPVRLAELEVLRPMARSSMDEAGPLFDRDVIARQKRDVNVIASALQRMAADGTGQCAARQVASFRVPVMPTSANTPAASGVASTSFSPTTAMLSSAVSVISTTA